MFEVPLEWLMDARQATARSASSATAREHTTWQIEHGGFVIWGITANLTRRFHDLALAGEVAA